MIRRLAALLALFAFAVAWLAGVFYGHSPLTRLENAGIALVAGLVTGVGVGIALERIVLARMADEWTPPGAAPEGEATPVANVTTTTTTTTTTKRAAAAVPAEAKR